MASLPSLFIRILDSSELRFLFGPALFFLQLITTYNFLTYNFNFNTFPISFDIHIKLNLYYNHLTALQSITMMSQFVRSSIFWSFFVLFVRVDIVRSWGEDGHIIIGMCVCVVCVCVLLDYLHIFANSSLQP
jgi:hypothetical protein